MDTLASARGKVRHGNRHIDALKRTLDAYLAAHPVELAVEDVAGSDQRQVVVRGIREPIPEDAPFVLGDAVHNLRSSLDHVIHYIAPGHPTAAFPVNKGSAPPDMTRLVRDGVRGAPKTVREALCALQPYPGGKHEAVWFLHRLDIADKHRALVVMVECFDGLVVDLGEEMRRFLFSLDHPPFPPDSVPSTPLVLRPDDTEVKVGKVLYTVPAGREITERFALNVGLGEEEMPTGKPVVGLLQSWSAQVTNLIDELAGLPGR